MLDALITSKTRLKLLLRFFLNSHSTTYLRNLENEFNESTNAIRQELNRFEEAKLLTSKFVGNKRLYRANTKHPLYKDIHSLLLKHVGFDQIIERVLKKLGEVKQVYVLGNFARGIDDKVIDLLIIGDDFNKSYLLKLIDKAEKIIHRKIRYLVLNQPEAKKYLGDTDIQDKLLLWENGQPTINRQRSPNISVI